MLRALGIVMLLLSAAAFLQGQEIYVSAENQPVNEVLTELRDQYNIRISFNDKQLSAHRITLQQNFDEPGEALAAVFEGLPFLVEKQGEIFIVYPKKEVTSQREYRLTGQVLDTDSKEPLPYAHVQINGITYAADQLGRFSYQNTTDSIFKVSVSHLGYYVLDTILSPANKVLIPLIPSSIGLKEVVITNAEVEKTTLIGSKPGLMKLNHKIAYFLPGFGDNSVFNLLRLMPGILASGESTNDLVIWGSYAGQSQVIFDNFTIFGLKNFNDNISSFNPLMAKDIEVLKGGYDARYGERVGGIVNITAKHGNLERPSFSVTVNNMTLNGMVEIPIAKKASLIFAIRHTYYNLYNPSTFNERFGRNNDNDPQNDVYIVPDYVFRDLNLKYTHNFSQNDIFYISLYGGNDLFEYTLDEKYTTNRNGQMRNWRLQKNTAEANTQFGGSMFYGKTWKNGNATDFIASYSQLKSGFDDDFNVTHEKTGFVTINRNRNSSNMINEMAAKVENRIAAGSKQVIDLSGGLIANQVEIAEDTFEVNIAELEERSWRIWSMIQDNIALGKNAVLKIGSRFTWLENVRKLYAEPRLSVSFSPGESWTLNASWGLYNQFITKASTVDDYGNYRYFWTISDNEDIPVLTSMHFVAGASFSKRGWLVSVEPYYKKVDGITQYFSSQLFNWEGILSGESRMYGVDFFIQKDYRRHSVWVAYSVSKVEERWPDLPNDAYRRAPQDQTHEVKAALLLNFDPFYFSTNYVYGSGFPRAPYTPQYEGDDLTYSRWDVSFIYKFLDRKVVGDIGLSLLNVLNTQNIKYTNFQRIPADQTNTINIYAEAIPFTPTLYLKIAM